MGHSETHSLTADETSLRVILLTHPPVVGSLAACHISHHLERIRQSLLLTALIDDGRARRAAATDVVMRLCPVGTRQAWFRRRVHLPAPSVPEQQPRPDLL